MYKVKVRKSKYPTVFDYKYKYLYICELWDLFYRL